MNIFLILLVVAIAGALVWLMIHGWRRRCAVVGKLVKARRDCGLASSRINRMLAACDEALAAYRKRASGGDLAKFAHTIAAAWAEWSSADSSRTALAQSVEGLIRERVPVVALENSLVQDYGRVADDLDRAERFAHAAMSAGNEFAELVDRTIAMMGELAQSIAATESAISAAQLRGYRTERFSAALDSVEAERRAACDNFMPANELGKAVSACAKALGALRSVNDELSALPQRIRNLRQEHIKALGRKDASRDWIRRARPILWLLDSMKSEKLAGARTNFADAEVKIAVAIRLLDTIESSFAGHDLDSVEGALARVKAAFDEAESKLAEVEAAKSSAPVPAASPQALTS